MTGDRLGEGREDLVTRLASGAAIVLVGRFGGRGIHVATHIIMARVLGAGGFGLFAVGWTLLNTVGLIAPLGLDRGALRFGSALWHSRERAERERFKGVILETIGISVVSGGVLAVAVFALAPTLAVDVFNDPDLEAVLRLFAPAFLFLPLMRVASAATRITQNMTYSAVSESLLQPITALVVLAAALYLGAGVLGAVGATVFSFVPAILLALVFVATLFPDVTSAEVRPAFAPKELLAFSLPASLAGILTLFTTRADRLFVAYFLTSSDVGVYQAVSQVAILFDLILSGFAAILMPMVPKLFKEGKLEDLTVVFRLSTRWPLYVGLPFVIVLLTAPGPLLGGIYGAEFAVGATALMVLTISQLTNAGTGPVGPVLVMTGHQNVWAGTAGVVLTVNALVNMVLIPRLGLVGAAITSLLSMVLLFGIGLVQIRRHIGIWPYDLSFLKGLVAAAATGALGYFLSTAWTIDSLLEIGAYFILVFLVFWGQLVLLGLAEEDRMLIQRIASRIQSSGEPENTE